MRTGGGGGGGGGGCTGRGHPIANILTSSKAVSNDDIPIFTFDICLFLLSFLQLLACDFSLLSRYFLSAAWN
jgi:hypothetical protein